ILNHAFLLFVSIVIPRRPQPCSTLFPYTTLFRSPLDYQSPEALNPYQYLLHMLLLQEYSKQFHVLFLKSILQTGHGIASSIPERSEEHTSELQSRFDLVCRLLLEKKKKYYTNV